METEHEHFCEKNSPYFARRQFLRLLLFSPLLASTGIISLDLRKTFSGEMPPVTGPGNVTKKAKRGQIYFLHAHGRQGSRLLPLHNLLAILF